MTDYMWDEFRERSYLFEPVEQHGWTWVPTMEAAPETWSLLDADGELMGDVYQRFNRVICWAPFTWGEEAYRSEEDVGEHGWDYEQRERHFAKIGAALRDWVRRKQEDGVDLVLLRDTYAYYFEASNGHHRVTVQENEYSDEKWRRRREDAAPALAIDGWQAEPTGYWNCEGYRLRDETGQLRGDMQVRFGVVRAVAARPEDANKMDPLHNPDYSDSGEGLQTCRGQIVLQERLRPMAPAFEPGERETWLRRAVDAVRATPDPDRAWPPETIGAWGTPGQQMFPTSRRE